VQDPRQYEDRDRPTQPRTTAVFTPPSLSPYTSQFPANGPQKIVSRQGTSATRFLNCLSAQMVKRSVCPTPFTHPSINIALSRPPNLRCCTDDTRTPTHTLLRSPIASSKSDKGNSATRNVGSQDTIYSASQHYERVSTKQALRTAHHSRQQLEALSIPPRQQVQPHVSTSNWTTISPRKDPEKRNFLVCQASDQMCCRTETIQASSLPRLGELFFVCFEGAGDAPYFLPAVEWVHVQDAEVLALHVSL
jgi:hypothetical protein